MTNKETIDERIERIGREVWEEDLQGKKITYRIWIGLAVGVMVYLIYMGWFPGTY